jgi:hypothetical protein
MPRHRLASTPKPSSFEIKEPCCVAHSALPVHEHTQHPKRSLLARAYAQVRRGVISAVHGPDGRLECRAVHPVAQSELREPPQGGGMKTAEALAPVVSPVQRPECVSCTRPMGRRRSALVNNEELFVCDLCWHLAGGAEAVAAKLAGEQAQPLLEFDPAAEALILSINEHDALHPLDRLLTLSGVRWSVLRRIVPAARVALAGKVLTRVAPSTTRPAQSTTLWMDAVEHGIRTSTEFRYAAKRRRWWRIARIFAICADHNGRPLTWISQEEVAAAVGCSDRTVRRCVSWLQRMELLWEVVPGCRLPMMDVPEDESPTERQERLDRIAASIAADMAARECAKHEIEAVRAGHRGAKAAAIASAKASASTSEDEVGHADEPKFNLVPVYELRIPMTAPERVDTDSLAEACKPRHSAGELAAQRHFDQLVHPQNAGLYSELIAIGHDGRQVRLAAKEAVHAVTCGYAVAIMRVDKIVHPPEVGNVDQLKSSYVRPVDKGRASRGSDKKGLPRAERSPDLLAAAQTTESKGDRDRRRPSRAQRAAERLLRSLLRPEVCQGVSIRWLTARLRASGLLDVGWTEQDLADHLHGLPDFPQLPHFIRNCRGWISARLGRANPHLPPSRLEAIAVVESAAADVRQAARQAHLLRVRRQEAQDRRSAIDNCELCDELGWLHVADDVPTVRCSHDLETGGW